MPRTPVKPSKGRKRKQTSTGVVLDFVAYRNKKLKLPTPKKDTYKKQKQEIVFVSADETFPKIPTVFKLSKDYVLGKGQEVEVTMLPFGWAIVNYEQLDAE